MIGEKPIIDDFFYFFHSLLLLESPLTGVIELEKDPRPRNQIVGEEEDKFRGTLEYVPGKQVTLAHVIRNPRKSLCSSLGVSGPGAVGLMTITPGEAAIIAADVASKAANVNVEFVDRFTGCLLFTGEISAVETALSGAVQVLHDILGFFPADITYS